MQMTICRAYAMACHGNAGIKNSQSDENMEPTPLKPTRSNLYGIFPPLFARQPFVVKSIVYVAPATMACRTQWMVFLKADFNVAAPLFKPEIRLRVK